MQFLVPSHHMLCSHHTFVILGSESFYWRWHEKNKRSLFSSAVQHSFHTIFAPGFHFQTLSIVGSLSCIANQLMKQWLGALGLIHTGLNQATLLLFLLIADHELDGCCVWTRFLQYYIRMSMNAPQVYIFIPWFSIYYILTGKIFPVHELMSWNKASTVIMQSFRRPFLKYTMLAAVKVYL